MLTSREEIRCKVQCDGEKGTQIKACLVIPGEELLGYYRSIVACGDRGHQGLHQGGHSALFLKDGFGRRRERGHHSLADREAGPVERPSGRWMCTGKETTDLATRRSVDGFAGAVWCAQSWGGDSAKAKG